MNLKEMKQSIIHEYDYNTSDFAYAFNCGLIYGYLYTELSIEESIEIMELQKLNRRLHYEHFIPKRKLY